MAKSSIRKDKGIALAAQSVPCAESTMRRLERKGVVKPIRDQWGRRLFGEDDIAAARQYLKTRKVGGYGPAR